MNEYQDLRVVRRQPDGSVLLSNGSALTPRELEVLAQIALGKSNPEIAGALFLSVHTVEFHATRIYQKLGVRNRFQASLAAKSLAVADGPAAEHGARLSRAVQDAPPSQTPLASEDKASRWRWHMAAIVGSFTAVVLVIVASAWLLLGIPRRSGDDNGRQAQFKAVDIAAAGPNAISLARELVPDAVLNQVVVDPAAGSTVFSLSALTPQPRSTL